eukprot:6201510-Pleurochrysis_carterae.AAC.1
MYKASLRCAVAILITRSEHSVIPRRKIARGACARCPRHAGTDLVEEDDRHHARLDAARRCTSSVQSGVMLGHSARCPMLAFAGYANKHAAD